MKMKNPLKKLLKKLSEGNYEVESLFNIIRNIVKEEFKIHKSNIKELINSNVNKTNDHQFGIYQKKNWGGTIPGKKKLKI